MAAGAMPGGPIGAALLQAPPEIEENIHICPVLSTTNTSVSSAVPNRCDTATGAPGLRSTVGVPPTAASEAPAGNLTLGKEIANGCALHCFRLSGLVDDMDASSNELRPGYDDPK